MGAEDRTRAVVVGGGIGGLAAGIALRRAGLEVAVWEKTPVLGEVGAGIMLWTNAMRALRTLGVADEVEAAGCAIERGSVRTWRGVVLSESPVGELGRKVGAPTVAIHRAELQRILYRALPGGTVRLGRTLVDVEQDESELTVRDSDGSDERPDVLIGADGIRSRVRAALFGEEPPRYAGYTAWRGIARFEHPLIGADGTGESWGRGARFGIVPIGRGRVYWFCTANAPRGEQDAAGGRKREVLERFRGWHAPIQDLIEATPEEAILRNDVVDRPPAARWGDGRVTLLGDAAHPMTPNLGQGACQAIEDTVAVARRLQEDGDVPAALRAYEASRAPRTAALIRQSWQLGRLGQLEHPLAVRLRDALVRGVPARVTRKQLEAVMTYEA